MSAFTVTFDVTVDVPPPSLVTFSVTVYVPGVSYTCAALNPTSLLYLPFGSPKSHSYRAVTGDPAFPEKAAYAAIPRWIARCMDDGRTKLQQQLAAAGYPHAKLENVATGAPLCREVAFVSNTADLSSFDAFRSELADARPAIDSYLGAVRIAVAHNPPATGELGARLAARPLGEQMLRLALFWGKGESAGLPAFLAHRFGEAPQRVHLVVDQRRKFEIGALVYPPGPPPDPMHAVGVIVETAAVGGIALVGAVALSDRYIVATEAGPSPARPATPPG